jgi:hypothetical protein
MSKCKSHNTRTTNAVRGGAGIISQVSHELPRDYPSIMDEVPTINSCPTIKPSKDTVNSFNLSCFPNPVANMATASHRGINPPVIFPPPINNEYFEQARIIRKTNVDGKLTTDGGGGILFTFEELKSSTQPERFAVVTPHTKKIYVAPADVTKINGKSVIDGTVAGQPLLKYMTEQLATSLVDFNGSVSIELLESPGNKGVIQQYSKVVADEIINAVASDGRAGSSNPNIVKANAINIANTRIASTVDSFGVNKVKFNEHMIANDDMFGYKYSKNNIGPYDQFNNSRKRNSPLYNEKYRETTASMMNHMDNNKSHMIGGQGSTQNAEYARNFDVNGLLDHFSHGAEPITQRDYYAMEDVADGNCDFDINSSAMADAYQAGNMNPNKSGVMYQGNISKDWKGFQGNFSDDFR